MLRASDCVKSSSNTLFSTTVYGASVGGTVHIFLPCKIGFSLIMAVKAKCHNTITDTALEPF